MTALLFLPPFLLGAALRLSLVAWGLPFWYDEVWTANFAAFPMPLGKALERLVAEDSHPPLAYALYRLWAEALGLRDPLDHRDPGIEAGLRALSALLGGGTAGFTALLARALGASPAPALAAGFLYALAPAALMREAEVHVYPPAAFFTALALFLWTKRHFGGFAAAAALALHAHHLAFLLLLLPALSFGVRGLLPYALALPWVLLGALQQARGLSEKSPFNGLPHEALAQMAAFAHWPEPVSVAVGAGVWLLALLAALTRKGRLPGLALLLYLALWLLLLPWATGFNAYSVRYVTLPLPLVLSLLALLLSGRWALLLLVPLLSWALLLPTVRESYLGFRSPSLLALALTQAPGPVLASSKPLAGIAKYACRSCPVELHSRKGLEAMEEGYLLLGKNSLRILAGEEPDLLPLLQARGARVLGEQGGILLVRLPPQDGP